jgi:zinc transporter ZupT
MKKVLTFLSISIGGWIGWWLGKYVGFMTAYLLSVVGGAAGLYIGRLIMKNYME